MPLQRDIQQGRIDIALSTFAQQYSNVTLLGEELAPRVPVGAQSGKYWKFGFESLQGGDADDTRAPGAAAERAEFTVSTDAFFCPDHSEEGLIPDEERAAEAYDPEQEMTRILTDRRLLRREVVIATLLSTAANFPTGHKVALTGTDQWSDAASTPDDDVDAAVRAIKLAIAKKPNLLILGEKTAQVLRRHATIKDQVKYTNNRVATNEDLANFFQIDRVVVWDVVKRSDAGVNTFVFDTHAVVAHVQPATSMMDLSALKTFLWTGAPGTVGGFQVELARATPVSRKADEIAVHMYYDVKITSDVSMYLIENAVA